MTPDSTPFKNRYIPVDQWPLACQQQWQAACTEADIFQKRKPATQWRKATIRKNVCGLGSLISWIIHTQNFRSNADVSEIVIRDHIAGFVKELREADYASNTIFNHVQGIHDCAKVMDPTQDWSWLLNAIKKLRSKAKPTRNKLKRLQPAQKLDLLGCKLMDEAETNAKLTFYKRALMFRDGLMISLLIHRPLRLTITRQEIEGRVLSGLKERLLAPELVAEFIKGIQEELDEQRRARKADEAQRSRRLAEVERKIAGLMRAIEDGLYEPSMKERLKALQQEKASLSTAADETVESELKILSHPNLPNLYRRKVEQLELILDGPDRTQAMDLIRSMIERVVLHPRSEGKGLDAELYGDLANILSACAGAQKKDALEQGLTGRQLSLVAGTSCQLYRTHLKY